MSLNFKSWFNEQFKEPNISQIESIYNKSHIALKLAESWPDGLKLLSKVSVVSNLSSGVYGIFLSKENQKVLPPDVESKLIHVGKVDKKNLMTLPNSYIKELYPDVDTTRIQESDTIHVNVRRIISEIKDDFHRVLEIASTIIHEATHVEDFQNRTKVNINIHNDPQSESHAKDNENKFQLWVKQNIQMLLTKIPELKTIYQPMTTGLKI